MECWRATPYGIPGRRRAPTGFAGYGVSLMLFVVALRNLGTACAGDYFLAAPLFGVVLSLALWPAMPPGQC
jgi:hypothetical protein